MDYRKNELTKQVVEKYKDSFSQTVGMSDFVPQKTMAHIYKVEHKNLTENLKSVKREIKKLQRAEAWANFKARLFGQSKYNAINDKLDKLIELLRPVEVENEEVVDTEINEAVEAVESAPVEAVESAPVEVVETQDNEK